MGVHRGAPCKSPESYIRLVLLRNLPHSLLLTVTKTLPEKYPQIKKLFGYDPVFKWKVVFVVFLQIASLYFIKDFSWPRLLLVGYGFGGVINHNLALGKFWSKLNLIYFIYYIMFLQFWYSCTRNFAQFGLWSWATYAQ